MPLPWSVTEITTSSVGTARKDRHRPAATIFGGIVEKIEEHLAEQIGIGPRTGGSPSARLDLEDLGRMQPPGAGDGADRWLRRSPRVPPRPQRAGFDPASCRRDWRRSGRGGRLSSSMETSRSARVAGSMRRRVRAGCVAAPEMRRERRPEVMRQRGEQRGVELFALLQRRGPGIARAPAGRGRWRWRPAPARRGSSCSSCGSSGPAPAPRRRPSTPMATLALQRPDGTASAPAAACRCPALPARACRTPSGRPSFGRIERQDRAARRCPRPVRRPPVRAGQHHGRVAGVEMRRQWPRAPCRAAPNPASLRLKSLSAWVARSCRRACSACSRIRPASCRRSSAAARKMTSRRPRAAAPR